MFFVVLLFVSQLKIIILQRYIIILVYHITHELVLRLSLKIIKPVLLLTHFLITQNGKAKPSQTTNTNDAQL